MTRTVRRPLRGTATSRTDGRHEPARATAAQHRGRFQSQGILGLGGIGQVEHAFDLLLQRDVAIKTLHRAGRGCEELRREACIASKLEHPNILPVYEILSDDQGHASGLVMRLVEGTTLSARLRLLGPAMYDQTVLRPILDALVQVCDALAYAHAQRVLHLDLKPENVMLDAAGRAFVLDWGSAVSAAPDTKGNLCPLQLPRQVMGTPLYMAPEQFHHHAPFIDQRTDIYALGGILYEAICGAAPFQAVEALRRGRNPPFVVPPVVLPVRTPLLTRLVEAAMRALAEDKDDRYPDVMSFRDALETIAREESFLPPLHFTEGTYIVREGDAAETAYILIEGECHVYRRVGGKDVAVARIRAGETFGESALLERGRRAASVVASTAVTLLAFDRKTLRESIGEGWSSTFVKSLVCRSNRSDPLPS